MKKRNVYHDNMGITKSNTSIQIEELPEFDNHRIVAFIADKTIGLSAFIAIHRGGFKNPAFGATRIWNYSTELDAARDALKLSKIMSYKSALAGLHHGGAKAVIIAPSKNHLRAKILERYAQQVNYFGGHLVTGADVGISMDDLRLMAKHSSNMIGLHSDPVSFTMLGVFYGIQVSLREVFGTDDLSKRSFAIQGLGKTGTGLLSHIYKEAKNIYVADINPLAVKAAKRQFPNVTPVKTDQIAFCNVDVFSPCAMSNVLNHASISKIRASIIAGSANSQLEDESAGLRLYKKGILYAPDYVINAGGLMAVVDEYEHKTHDAIRVKRKVATIKKTLADIFQKSKRMHKSPSSVADVLARNISETFV